MPLTLALLALAAPAPAQTKPAATTAQIERSLLCVVADERDEKDVQDVIRKGAHLLATRDLSELTDAMKAAERAMKDAMKDVDSASVKALKDFAAKALR